MHKLFGHTIVFLALMLAGCANSYRIERDGGASHPTVPLIAKTDRVLVTLPSDGAYGATRYQGSGQSTQQAVIASLAALGVSVAAGGPCDDPSAAAELGRQASVPWVVAPRIHQWEDRATEWSGLPDRIRIELRVIAIPADSPSDTTIVVGSSKWATFGGDHHQDMLLPALKPWADAIVKK